MLKAIIVKGFKNLRRASWYGQMVDWIGAAGHGSGACSITVTAVTIIPTAYLMLLSLLLTVPSLLLTVPKKIVGWRKPWWRAALWHVAHNWGCSHGHIWPLFQSLLPDQADDCYYNLKILKFEILSKKEPCSTCKTNNKNWRSDQRLWLAELEIRIFFLVLAVCSKATQRRSQHYWYSIVQSEYVKLSHLNLWSLKQLTPIR